MVRDELFSMYYKLYISGWSSAGSSSLLHVEERKRKRKQNKIKRMLKDSSDPFRIDDFYFIKLFKFKNYNYFN